MKERHGGSRTDVTHVHSYHLGPAFPEHRRQRRLRFEDVPSKDSRRSFVESPAGVVLVSG